MRRAAARQRIADKARRPADLGLHLGATAPYDPLPAGEVARIIAAARQILARTGVVFEGDSEACTLLRGAGCAVAPDGVVRIPPELVDAALATTARSTRLWDRDGARAITLDCQHTWFFPGMTCIRIFDLETGQPRPSSRDDLALVTRIADGLPNIDGVCVACKNVTRTDPAGEIDEFVCMVENTTKPLEYLCEHAASLAAVIAVAAAVRGGTAGLREKPYFLHIITPLPLHFAACHSDQIILAARAGVPASVGTLPIGGATSPITLAGCIAHALATDLAAMVLAQLAARGCFCIGSSDVCFMEPATGAIGSFSQTSLADMAMCQIRRALGLPSFTGIGGTSAAQRFNQDSVWEISANLMQAFYSRPATCDYLGSLDQGLIFCLHSLLLCDDLAGLLRQLWQGFAVSDAQLALEVIHAVGPRGNFLAQRHTVDNCRAQVWESRYFGAHLPLGNPAIPDLDLFDRIDRDLRTRLAIPLASRLPERTRQAIAAILQGGPT